MKINFIPTVIAFAASALIAYGFYSGCRAEDMCILVTILGGLSLFLTLGTTFGVSFSRSRTAQNVKAGSGFFAGLILVLNIVFCCLSSFSKATYIVLDGLTILIWLITIYGIVKTSEKM